MNSEMEFWDHEHIINEFEFEFAIIKKYEIQKRLKSILGFIMYFHFFFKVNNFFSSTEIHCSNKI